VRRSRVIRNGRARLSCQSARGQGHVRIRRSLLEAGKPVRKEEGRTDKKEKMTEGIPVVRVRLDLHSVRHEMSITPIPFEPADW